VAEGDDELAIHGAADLADAFGAGEWGRVLGWWHDVGKYSDAFQTYIKAARDPHRAETGGRVDHSTAGAQHAAAQGESGRLLAYAIAGHHAGLPDGAGDASSLKKRLTKPIDPWHDATPAEVLDHAVPDRPPITVPTTSTTRAAFSIAFFTRMLFSCLVDADFLATEAFMARDRAAHRPTRDVSLAQILEKLDAHLAGFKADSPVNRERANVLAACRTKATQRPGFYSLAVPTGGGKTLASLAFALTHARTHGLRRVIYAIPFTSIVEQTADVFRTRAELPGVLEVHSNLDPDDPDHQSTRSRLAAENFDAPLVVTTNVQLLESLFASGTSRCRKLHRLAGSVIIFDEAQTLPPNLLRPTLWALDELVRNYGCSIVLCTATQPAIERRDGFDIGLENVTPIIDDPKRLHDALRRTRVELVGELDDEALADRIADEPQVLCIVNTRRQAQAIAERVDEAIHLSANQCAAHRSEIVATIRQRLVDKQPCRVISTAVIEAGVDVDFPCVYRAAAGLDSIAQAAGRCNREGTLPKPGRVYVFEPDAGYRPPPFVRRAADKFREVAPDHLDDLLSPAAIEDYFRLFYWQQGGDDGTGWDRGTGDASVCETFALDTTGPTFQFRQAAERYRLIEDAQTPVLVPWGDGIVLRKELEKMPDDVDPKRLRAWDRRAQRYVVGVFDHELTRLRGNTIRGEKFGRYYLSRDDAYDGRLGLLSNVEGMDPARLNV
jgi:CRISPR-associated endonuclease/helicase Cas3